jgi:hypothetical protein
MEFYGKLLNEESQVKSRVMALLLVLALLPAAPSVTAAQTAQTDDPAQRAATNDPATDGAQDWQDLQDLKPGTRILVEFKTSISDPVKAKFVSATGTTLTVTSDGYTRGLGQRDIQSVYLLHGRWSRGKAAKIGAATLGLTGAYIGARQDARSSSPQPGGGVSGLSLGVLAGAGLGALLGGKRKGKLLYEAK